MSKKIIIVTIIALISTSYFYIKPLIQSEKNIEKFSYEHHKSFKQIDIDHANIIRRKLLKDLEKIPQSIRQLYEANKKDRKNFIPPTNKKPNDIEYVLAWFSYAASDTHSFTAENYIMRLNDFPTYFTENGFTQYLIILDRAELPILLDYQIQQGIKGYSIKSNVLSKPKLLSLNTIDGIKEWTLSVPIKMTFGTESTSSTEVEVTASIIESFDTRNTYGLAIDDLTVSSQ